MTWIQNKTDAAIPFDFAARTYILPPGRSEVAEDVALSAQARLSPYDFAIVHLSEEQILADRLDKVTVAAQKTSEEIESITHELERLDAIATDSQIAIAAAATTDTLTQEPASRRGARGRGGRGPQE